MKKAGFFILVLGLVAVFAQAAFADDGATFSTALKGDSGFIETSTFFLDQKPWLHINVPDTFSKDWTFSFWNSPEEGSSTFLSNVFNEYIYQKVGNYDIYLTFSDDKWEDIAYLGDWEVSAATVLQKSSNDSCPSWWTRLAAYSGTAKFNVVTPEPVSSVLFLLGAGTLAYATRKRKK
jgi:hypothetical protein